MTIEQQLADYGRHLEQAIALLEVQARPDHAESPADVPGRLAERPGWSPGEPPPGTLLETLDAGGSRKRVSARRGMLIAAAAVVVVLLIAVPLLFLWQGDEPQTAVTEGTPITTATSAGSTTTPGIPPGAQLTWTRVTDTTGALSGPGFETVSQVIAGGPGLVAVGAADSCYPDCDWGEGAQEIVYTGFDWGGNWSWWQGGAVWVSTDGETWTRVPDARDVFGSGVALLTGVADNGSRLVAVGIVATPGGTATGKADPRAGVWVSDDDGASWTRVPDDPAAFGGEGRHLVWSVIATDTGFVAAGDDLWSSPDGWQWTRLGPMEEVRRLARTPEGYVAVGVDGTTAVAWTSPDGLSWTPVELAGPPSVAGSVHYTVMNDVVAVPGGVVAVGQEGRVLEGNMDGAVWVSTGEDEWLLLDGQGAFAKGLHQEIRGVAVIGDRLVAVGTQRGVAFNAFAPVQSWVSDDGGLTWTAVTGEALGPRGAFMSMTAVAVLDGKLIAMGEDGEEVDVGVLESDLAVWIGTWGE